MYPPPNKKTVRIEFVDKSIKSMLLRSTTKPPIL